VEVSRPGAGRHPERDTVVEGDQAGRVALPVHQKRERRRQHRSVFELAHRSATSIRHRGADVQQHVTLEVGFFFVLLDVVPIAPGVDLPVEGGQVVAGQILTVLGELDTEAFVGAAMKTGKKPLDDRPRLQLHRSQLGNDSGIQESQVARGRRGRHDGYIPLRGIGTASRSRSTRLSADTRSDSA
jgi:hypothetical protein